MACNRGLVECDRAGAIVADVSAHSCLRVVADSLPEDTVGKTVAPACGSFLIDRQVPVVVYVGWNCDGRGS